MATRGAAIAIGLACALVLGGCATATSYPQADAGQIESERQRILDLTWQNLGLVHEATRPTPAVVPLADDADWIASFYACIEESGSTSNGFGYSSLEGFDLRSGYELDDSTLLSAYSCVASLPIVPFALNELRTAEQVDFLYEYFNRWLIPCLETHGWVVRNIPTKEEFATRGGLWSPYEELNLIDVLDNDRLLQSCGMDPANDRLNDGLEYLQTTADDIESGK